MQEMRQIRLDPSKLERRGPTKIPKINKREGRGEDYYLELESSTNIILIFYFSAKAY